MKDSPLMLLLPVVVIIGAVGLMFLQNVLPPVPNETESLQSEEIVETEVESEVSSSTIAVIKFNTGTSSANTRTPEEREARMLELEKIWWHNKNLILEEPCDFPEIERFADELLAEPEWAEVMRQYPNRAYSRREEGELGIIGASKWLHTCYIEVDLQTNELSHEEYDSLPYEKIIKTWQVLPLLNNEEDYSTAYTEFSLEDISFATLLADGPNSSSYGTYQYSDDLKRVRLFGVSHSGAGRISVYEAEATGEDPCPCGRQLTLRITNEISAEDMRTALEKAKLPDNFEKELKKGE